MYLIYQNDHQMTYLLLLMKFSQIMNPSFSAKIVKMKQLLKKYGDSNICRDRDKYEN